MSQLTIYCQLFYPELISTGQTLTELAEALSKKNIHVSVVCGPITLTKNTQKTPPLITHRGIRIQRVWGTQFPKLNTIGRLINQLTFTLSATLHLLFEKSNTPLLILTNPPFLAWCCVLINKFKKRPLLYLIFDLYPDTAISCGLMKQTSIIASTWNRLNRWVYRNASHIIVIGRCMKTRLLSSIPPSMQTAIKPKIHSIHVWADDQHIQNAPELSDNILIKKWHLQNQFRIVYSGNMGRFHDMLTFLDAAEHLKEEKEITFLFIGDGAQKASVIENITKRNLHNCQVHNYVSRNDLPQLLQLTDIGLVSLKTEQTGASVPSKTYGILSAGKPVIAVMSDQCEIAQMIREENCGFVFKSKESHAIAKTILTLKNNPNHSHSLGRNGQNAIQTKYSLNHAAEQYKTLLLNMSQSPFGDCDIQRS